MREDSAVFVAICAYVIFGILFANFVGWIAGVA